jgi:exopolyphosphatase / guanosine-5'-triphosphate,3'-diphosphate pyrophosphatase
MFQIKNGILSAIDIGTNSFHLIIAKIHDDKFSVIDQSKEVVRLGVSSSDMKYITEEAMDRGVMVLKRFKSLSDLHDASIRAVATSAVREALNKAEFIRRVKAETDIDIEIISGYEEARLIYLGVLQSLPVFKDKVLIVDIGGGSTEFLCGQKGDIIFAESLKLGSIRYTQKFFANEKLDMNALYDCRESVRGVITPVIRNIDKRNIDHFIGTSGTINNIASIIKGIDREESIQTLNNYTFTRKELSGAVDMIFSYKTNFERSKIPGLDAGRSDIIAAGAIILEQIFSELKIKEMTVSDFALREGVVLDSIHKSTGAKKLAGLTDIRYKSVQYLMELCKVDDKHAKQVNKTALQLFDSLKNIHKLESSDREYLEAACLLHDVGYYISHSQHHRHSYYIIRNAELLGFSDREIEIMANVARYHRKSHPKVKHEGFGRLSIDDQERVKRLSSLIRIADGLDRSHLSLVSKIEPQISVKNIILKLKLREDKDISLDIWGADRKKELFEELFGYKVKFSIQ